MSGVNSDSPPILNVSNTLSTRVELNTQSASPSSPKPKSKRLRHLLEADMKEDSAAMAKREAELKKIEEAENKAKEIFGERYLGNIVTPKDTETVAKVRAHKVSLAKTFQSTILFKVILKISNYFKKRDFLNKLNEGRKANDKITDVEVPQGAPLVFLPCFLTNKKNINVKINGQWEEILNPNYLEGQSQIIKCMSNPANHVSVVKIECPLEADKEITPRTPKLSSMIFWADEASKKRYENPNSDPKIDPKAKFIILYSGNDGWSAGHLIDKDGEIVPSDEVDRYLKEGWNVMIPDRMGTGNSSPDTPKSNRDIFLQANAPVLYLKENGIIPVVKGYSFGSTEAGMAAAANPGVPCIIDSGFTGLSQVVNGYGTSILNTPSQRTEPHRSPLISLVKTVAVLTLSTIISNFVKKLLGSNRWHLDNKLYYELVTNYKATLSKPNDEVIPQNAQLQDRHRNVVMETIAKQPHRVALNLPSIGEDENKEARAFREKEREAFGKLIDHMRAAMRDRNVTHIEPKSRNLLFFFQDARERERAQRLANQNRTAAAA